MKKFLFVLFSSFTLISCEIEDPDQIFFKGLLNIYGNQWQQAIQQANEVIEVDDEYLAAYIIRATAYLSTQQWDKCISDCDKMLELNPDESLAYVLRGDAKYMQQKFDEALKDYEKASELKPESFWEMHILRQKAGVEVNKNPKAACEYWQTAYQKYGDYQSLTNLQAASCQ